MCYNHKLLALMKRLRPNSSNPFTRGHFINNSNPVKKHPVDNISVQLTLLNMQQHATMLPARDVNTLNVCSVFSLMLLHDTNFLIEKQRNLKPSDVL